MFDTTNPGEAGDTGTTEVGQTADTGTDTGTHDDLSNTDDSGNEDEGDGQSSTHDDDSEEVDYEGKKFRAPKGIKEAILRQADYTQKTQALSQQRRDFEQSRDATLANDKAFNDAKVRLGVIDHNLEAYKNVDWDTLQAQDPNAAAQHWRNFTLLKDQRADAERGVSQAKQRIDSDSQTSRSKRVVEVQAQLPKMIPGFNAEVDKQLITYGTANGWSGKDVVEATLHNPAAAVMLWKAMQYDKGQSKAATAAAAAKQGAAQPAAEIGNNKGTRATTRRTTDSSGDKMSTADWVKAEQARVAKKLGKK
jgi:hypothetical protein